MRGVINCGALLLILFLAFAAPAFAVGKTIYVDDDANGLNNGTSWENAYKFLQDTLADANSSPKPVEIRVAQGIYKPDQGAGITPGDRVATFRLINGVTLKGGYAGSSPNPNERDVEEYKTVLSGDLMGNDIEFTNRWDLILDPTWSENSYHVVTGSGTDATAVLDGFTITAGNANAVYQYDKNAIGGGMYNKQGSPALANCTFIHNLTLWNGSAIYNESSNPILTNCTFTENGTINSNGTMHNYESSPILTDCTFSNNTAFAGDGAGICNRSHSSPTLTDCIFTGNVSGYYGSGGGLCNYHSNPTLTNCTFTANSAYVGGGMSNVYSSPTLTNCTFRDNSCGYIGVGGGMANSGEPILSNCTFSGNSAGKGAGISNSGNPTLINCTFSNNRAFFWGGGIDNSGSPTLTNCTFSGNRAAIRWGGGMYNSGGSPILTKCTFTGNTAEDYGGGMEISGSPSLLNCTFSQNAAQRGGGVSIRNYSTPTFSGCAFTGNRAQIGGGIANCYGNSIELDNCIFTGNSSTEKGGAMYNYGGYRTAQAVLTNCTFAENLAPDGSALFCESYNQEYSSNLELTNCILWDCDSEISNNDGSDITIIYSDVQGGWPGEGNINADPRFISSGYWDADGTLVNGDYHLLADSPCIDAGTDAGVYTDIEGNVRPFDYPGVDNNGELLEFDMGAYEMLPWVKVPMKFTPQAINCRSSGKWVKAHFVLPAEFKVVDVDTERPAKIEPLDIESKYLNVFVNEDGLVEVDAAFDRAAFCDVAGCGSIEITVVGLLTDGRYFYGTDTIKIIKNGVECLAILSSYWLQINCGKPDWCNGFDIDRDSVVNLKDFAIMALHWLEER